ncbi:MAG TPA: L-seryl-tRNA(Sec) selenium transferase [Vicinamibacteria bacterium]|nr:L-seryl-tRNA(Sec) selenium transferase [Vicinamibacteria bacterium]
MPPTTGVDPRRQLPSVDQALQRAEVQALVEAHGRPAVVRALRSALEALRERAAAGAPGLDVAVAALAGDVAARLEAARRPSLRRVLNATGVVVHTNLGRAPLSPEAAARVAEIAASYSNLEYDLERGARGDRETHVEARLRDLLGVEATVVVNNCAAAVLLAVNTLAEGREVLVSRGELVEIGGSFRIPDVLRKGGARLREIGTTNRTRLSDFRAALSPETGMILKVHPSNFRIVGFTEAPSLEELSGLAREAGIPLVEDHGSGLLEALPGALAAEATAVQALRGGADVVTFSGDKLLGGPQAGLVAGRRAFVEPMRKNPLYRALRVDKMTLAALDVTLVEHGSGRAAATVPVLRMIHAAVGEVRARAEAFARALTALAPALRPALVDGESAVGGGAAPTTGVPTVAVALDPGPSGADRLAAALRAGSPPVVVRVAEDRLLVDLRTVRPDEEEPLLAALAAAARAR